jgi:hypothetical protein
MIELVFKHQQNILWVLYNILVVIKDYSKTIDNEKTKKKKHLRSWLNGGRGLFPSSAPGFELYCVCFSSPRCLTCSLGLQDVQWAVRLVVMRVNWPGHPRKKKKKKEITTNTSLTTNIFDKAMMMLLLLKYTRTKGMWNSFVIGLNYLGPLLSDLRRLS